MFPFIAGCVLLLYALKEFLSWWRFMASERGGQDEEIEETTDAANIRTIERNGHIYAAPTRTADHENNVFEWQVKRFRVEGEGLIEDKSYGKNSDYNDVSGGIRPRFNVEGDDPD